MLQIEEIVTYLLIVSADAGIRSLSVKNDRSFTRNTAKYGNHNTRREQCDVIHFNPFQTRIVFITTVRLCQSFLIWTDLFPVPNCSEKKSAVSNNQLAACAYQMTKLKQRCILNGTAVLSGSGFVVTHLHVHFFQEDKKLVHTTTFFFLFFDFWKMKKEMQIKDSVQILWCRYCPVALANQISAI